MFIWILIMVVVLSLAVLSFAYLVNKVTKLGLVRKLTKEKKVLKILTGIGVNAVAFIIVCLLIGTINAIVCLLHLVVFLLLSDLINFAAGKVAGKKFSHRIANIVGVIFTICYLGAGWFLAHNVWTSNYTLTTDKNVSNLRVVQFADSHVGTTFNGVEFAEYVDRMQEENPDVVVITGDYVDDDTSRVDMINACQALGRLNTTYGVYYSFGNHDKGYYGSEGRGYTGDDLIAELTKNGVKVLQDEAVEIAGNYYIIGRQDKSEDLTENKRADMSELTSTLDNSKYMIVLDHQPNDYANESSAGVDLVLSGHTHGGQLFPVNFVGEWTKTNDFTYGFTKRDNTEFIVTSGISDWALDFKTGCKSEFVVIDIAKK